MSFKKALLLTAALGVPAMACSSEANPQPVTKEAKTAVTVPETTIRTTGALSLSTCLQLEKVQEKLGEPGSSTVRVYAGQEPDGKLFVFGEVTYGGDEMAVDSKDLVGSISPNGVIDSTPAKFDVLAASSTLDVAAQATSEFSPDMDLPIDGDDNDQLLRGLIAVQDQARQEINRAIHHC